MAALRVCFSGLPRLSYVVCRGVVRRDCLKHRGFLKTRLPHVRMSASSYSTSAPSQGDVEGEFSLAKKKCVPCSSEELRPMTEEAARTLLPQIPEWALLELDGKFQLQRSWKAKNFVKGLEFFKCIADIAESEGELGQPGVSSLHETIPVIPDSTLAAGYQKRMTGNVTTRHFTTYDHQMTWWSYPQSLKQQTLGTIPAWGRSPLETLAHRGQLQALNRHHPDLHLVGWNNVTVNIFTHSIGGLTENDFILAAKIDALDCKQLLRRNPPKSPPVAT